MPLRAMPCNAIIMPCNNTINMRPSAAKLIKEEALSARKGIHHRRRGMPTSLHEGIVRQNFHSPLSRRQPRRRRAAAHIINEIFLAHIGGIGHHCQIMREISASARCYRP